MELRSFALDILESDSVTVKLTPPDVPCTDHDPGQVLRLERPARSERLRIRQGREVKVPPLEGMHDPAQRRRILHAFANHEFQAVELFAWAILAFPEAPVEFRRGLCKILQDEQRHTRMYITCINRLGIEFGDEPVTGYFWNKIGTVHTPQQFICAMSLTFENANLDHAVDYAGAARAAGDEKTAIVIDRVHEDEIEHVRFGWHWLKVFKEAGQSMSEAYRQSLTWPLRPALARGVRFNTRSRIRAGLDDEFIKLLAESEIDHEAKRLGRREDR